MSKSGINRNLPNNAYEAATNANDPSALNPFVTQVDAAVNTSSLILYPTTATSPVDPSYKKLVKSITDPDYDDPAVDLSTGAITTTSQLIAELASAEGVIVGNPGTINVNTIGNIRRASGSGTATFYYEIYHRTNLGVETLIGTSNTTYDATSAVYEQFFASALVTGITFTTTDRVVSKWYANRISGGSDPVYEIQIGGATPVKITFPVAVSLLPNGHIIEDEGITLPQRDYLDFQGAGVTVTDVGFNNRTVVTIPGGGTSNLTVDSTGVLTGGVLSVGTPNTTFSITDGTGQIVDSAGVKTLVSWTGKTNITVTNIATNLITFVAIDSGSNVIQSTTKFTAQQARTLIILGVVVHVNLTNVDTVNNEQKVAYNVMSSVYDGFESLGFFNISGNVFSANGANLNINKSAGVMFKMGSNYDTDINNPHKRTLGALSPAQFQYRFSNGTSGILTETNIDPNNLDNGSGGLTAVGTNRWSVQRIYSFTSNNVKIQRGVADYSTSAAAIDGITTEAYITEPSIAANGLFRGWLIVKQGATALNGADAIFLAAGKLGEATASGGGGTGSGVQNNFSATTAPTVSNDNTQGYEVGSVWVNLTTDRAYTCVDSSTGAAVWRIHSHIVEDEGTPLAQRNTVNFTGAGVTVSDAGGKTVVTIPGGGAGSAKYTRNMWMFNVATPAGYTWNGTSIAAPTAAITSTGHPHRLYNFSGTNNQHQGFYFEQQLPSIYTAGANIRVTLNVTALTATGGAVFFVGLCQPSAGNVLGGTTENEWIQQTATFTGVTGYHVVPVQYTFTGTNITAGDSLLFRVYRNPNDAADTLGTVGIVSLSIEEL